MTPAGEILRDHIRRDGPQPFRVFMDTALYHPEAGYYRRRPVHDPFGAGGDFYTAEQLQPVFGLLMGTLVRQWCGGIDGAQVVELGAGRCEMSKAFAPLPYLPVEWDASEMPVRIRGAVLANEFFDALPVDRAVREHERWYESLVGWDGVRFVWRRGSELAGTALTYVTTYSQDAPSVRSMEVPLAALDWMHRIATSLEAGELIAIDYGYSRRELQNFPDGTLMSYRRHRAIDDVLLDPGMQDITAHVCFDAIRHKGESLGLSFIRLEPLSRTLLEAGQADSFTSVLADDPDGKRKLQLKTLLFGMGETFRTLRMRAEGS